MFWNFRLSKIKCYVHLNVLPAPISAKYVKKPFHFCIEKPFHFCQWSWIKIITAFFQTIAEDDCAVLCLLKAVFALACVTVPDTEICLRDFRAQQGFRNLVTLHSCDVTNHSRKVLFVRANRSDEGLTLETSAFYLFTVANFPYQLSW